MSEVFFRRKEFKYKDEVKIVEQISIKELFRFDEAPYVIVANSGCGKTTLCMDILHKFAPECTSIYYVTATEESVRDDSIRQVPVAFRRKPTFESLYALWQEISATQAAAEPKEETLTSILFRLCGQSEGQMLLKKLTDKRNQISSERKTFYLSHGDDNNDAIKKSENDSKAFFIDTLSKLLLDRATTRGTSKLTTDDMTVLSALVSPYPKTLLMLDDVSSELNELSTQSKKVVYKGQPTKVSDAYKSLLMDILTRGRHMNAIICLFVHTIDLIQNKGLINNIIILNKEAGSKIVLARSFSETTREMINQACKEILGTKEYPYCFFAINQTKDTYSVGRADLHYGETIPLSKINSEFVKAVNNINSGIDVNSIAETSTAVDDDESESEDEDALDQFTLDRPM